MNGAALLSLGAAAIHFAVVPEHFTHSMLYGMFFAFLAIAQIGWSVALVASPTRPVLVVGALVNSFVILVWVLSRTTGIPVGPEAGAPEAVGLADTSATIFEGLVILFCLALTKEGVRMKRVPAGAVSAATLALALAVVPLAGATIFASGVDQEQPTQEMAGMNHDATSNSSAAQKHHATKAKPAGSQTHVVKMLDNSFAPQQVRIEPGDTVKWVNEGQAPHTATSDTNDFDSSTVDPGKSFSFTFKETGAYVYYCEFHGSPGRQGMWGMVTVANKGDKAVPVKVGSAPAPTSKGSSAAASVTVSVLDSSFAPQQVNVEVGDTVEWVSKSAMTHTVTQDEGTFDSGDLTQGSTFSETFDQPGIYKYYCRYHGSPGVGMWGVVQVTRPGETAKKIDTSSPAPQPVAVPTTPDTSKVSVQDNFFSPRSLSINVGDSVVWANEGSAPHTATADSGTFDSGTLNPGQTFKFTFSKAGTYSYLCEIHGSSMSGTIVVTEPGQSTAPKVPPKGGGGGKPPAPVKGAKQVSVQDDSFSPKSLSVPTGTTVQWINKGDSSHTVTAESNAPKRFNSGNLNPGQSFKTTFSKPGNYYYYCQYHGSPRSGMWAVVHVGSSGGGGGGGTPPPGGGGGGGKPKPAPGAEQVAIKDDLYSPKDVTVPVGTTVQWMHQGESSHTVTSKPTAPASFNSGTMGPGDSFKFTFDKPGTYAYFCQIHGSEMSGVIQVGGSGGGGGGGGRPPPGGGASPPGGGNARPQPPKDHRGHGEGDDEDHSGPGDGGEDHSGPGDGDGEDHSGSGHGGSAGSDAVTEEHDVSIDDNEFDEAAMHIAPGDLVVWENDGDNTHSVTSGSGAFDSGGLSEDETFRRAFNEPGIYRYHCKFHQGMTGVIYVEGQQQSSFAAGRAGTSLSNIFSVLLLSASSALLLWLRRARGDLGHA